MDKIKSFVREVFSLERITVCLCYVIPPISILSASSFLVAELANINFVKAVVIVITSLGVAFVCLFVLGVLSSIIYTTYLMTHNKCRYKDEDLYEDIDYEDEDTDE